MGTGQYQKAAPKDLLFIARITATRTEDCAGMGGIVTQGRRP